MLHSPRGWSPSQAGAARRDTRHLEEEGRWGRALEVWKRGVRCLQLAGTRSCPRGHLLRLCELRRFLPSASLLGCLCKWLENVFCRRLCPCSSPLGHGEGRGSRCWSRCLAAQSILGAACPSRSRCRLSCTHDTGSGDVTAQSRAGGVSPIFPPSPIQGESFAKGSREPWLG